MQVKRFSAAASLDRVCSAHERAADAVARSPQASKAELSNKGRQFVSAAQASISEAQVCSSQVSQADELDPVEVVDEDEADEVVVVVDELDPVEVVDEDEDEAAVVVVPVVVNPHWVAQRSSAQSRTEAKSELSSRHSFSHALVAHVLMHVAASKHAAFAWQADTSPEHCAPTHVWHAFVEELEALALPTAAPLPLEPVLQVPPEMSAPIPPLADVEQADEDPPPPDEHAAAAKSNPPAVSP